MTEAALRQRPRPATTVTPARTGLLRRKCACGGSPGLDGECAGCREKRLQRRATSQASPTTAPPIVNEVLQSPGRPLDAATRAFMEPRFGHDFSRVRVHTDARAAESAGAVDALAYTVGQDVVFGSGQYAPGTRAGRSLLAHELTHVVQQPPGPSTTAYRISPPSSSYEREAELASAAIDSSHAPRVRPNTLGEATIMRDVTSATSSPSGGAGRPPAGLTGCHVYLGGRLIDDRVAGTLGFRHLYIDVYEGPSNYALIEAGPVGSTSTGTSGAWVKNMDWGARGIQWDITPSQDCPNFIACLKQKTSDYHAAAHPYHYSRGPNSNSFAWWVLHECGLDISFMISRWPYLGVDYWRSRPAPTPAPPTTPATP